MNPEVEITDASTKTHDASTLNALNTSDSTTPKCLRAVKSKSIPRKSLADRLIIAAASTAKVKDRLHITRLACLHKKIGKQTEHFFIALGVRVMTEESTTCEVALKQWIDTKKSYDDKLRDKVYKDLMDVDAKNAFEHYNKIILRILEGSS